MDTLKSTPQWGAVKHICEKLKAAGFEALLAGGCVRDGLLGTRPKDFDIATSAKPEEVEKLFSKTVPVGKSFGVIRVAQEHFEFELATFRKDGPYIDGRRPQSVVYCSAEEDAKRRDFTINALFFDPLTDKLYDYVEGQKDLKNKLIRTVGLPEERFTEDHLRMLRVARFHGQLGFEIEEATALAVKKLVDLISDVSAERVRDEMGKLLISPSMEKAMEFLKESNLYDRLFPEVKDSFDVIFERLKIAKSFVSENKLELLWATFLMNFSDLKTFLIKRKFSNKSSEMIVQAIQVQKTLASASGWTRAQTLLFLKESFSKLAVELFLIESKIQKNSEHEKTAAYLKLQSKDFAGLPQPLLTSEDLFTFGLKEGKDLGVWLKKALEAQLNLEFASKAGALEWYKKNRSDV